VKVHLNLATQPFGHRRVFWLATGASAILLAVVAAWLVTIYLRHGRGLREMNPSESELRAELSALQAEEIQLRNKLNQPGNEQVLARSLFLNQLLHRKGISWTRTFADLEEILPPRVRVVSIRPEVTIDNNVLLDMQVGAEKPEDCIELLQVLERSDWFGSPDVRSFSPPTDNNPLFQYRVLVSYEQQL
jgi:type IV pilus assembly protein PilN